MARIHTDYQRLQHLDGMDEADHFCRQEAIGVDLDACERAAAREARRAFQLAMDGHMNLATLRMYRATYRLSIALGNQSRAQHCLVHAECGYLPHMESAEELADRAELDRAVQREYPHAALVRDLARTEEAIRIETHR